MNNKLENVNTFDRVAASEDAAMVRTVMGSALLKLEMAVINATTTHRDPGHYSNSIYMIMNVLDNYVSYFEDILKAPAGKNTQEYPIKKTKMSKSAADFHQEDKLSDVRIEKALNHAYRNFRNSGKEFENEIQEIIRQCKLYHEQFEHLVIDINESSTRFQEKKQREAEGNSDISEPALEIGQDGNSKRTPEQQQPKKKNFVQKVKDLLQK